MEHADRLAASTILTECASLLTRGKHVSSSNPNVFENVVKSYLAKCKSVKSLFVIRTRKKEARALEGDVVVFDLASGKHQGGFPLSIQSAGRTDKVTNTTTTSKTTGAGGRRRTTKTSTSTESSVNSDESQLRSNLADAIDAGIRKPSRPPSSPSSEGGRLSRRASERPKPGAPRRRPPLGVAAPVVVPPVCARRLNVCRASARTSARAQACELLSRWAPTQMPTLLPFPRRPVTSPRSVACP